MHVVTACHSCMRIVACSFQISSGCVVPVCHKQQLERVRFAVLHNCCLRSAGLLKAFHLQLLLFAAALVHVVPFKSDTSFA